MISATAPGGDPRGAHLWPGKVIRPERVTQDIAAPHRQPRYRFLMANSEHLAKLGDESNPIRFDQAHAQPPCPQPKTFRTRPHRKEWVTPPVRGQKSWLVAARLEGRSYPPSGRSPTTCRWYSTAHAHAGRAGLCKRRGCSYFTSVTYDAIFKRLAFRRGPALTVAASESCSLCCK
jgi:hypothetical protein